MFPPTRTGSGGGGGGTDDDFEVATAWVANLMTGDVMALGSYTAAVTGGVIQSYS